MKNPNKSKQLRKAKSSSKVRASSDRIRLCVFRSSKHGYAQLVDDAKQRVIIGVSDRKISAEGKTEKAKKVGQEIAKLALEKKIKEVSFDRRGYKYHGRIKALAEGAREKGLKF